MNRLKANDKCTPKDYDEWKWVSKCLDELGVPQYRQYYLCEYHLYTLYPSFNWSDSDWPHEISANRIKGQDSVGRYNELSVEDFLHKAGYRSLGPKQLIKTFEYN